MNTEAPRYPNSKWQVELQRTSTEIAKTLRKTQKITLKLFLSCFERSCLVWRDFLEKTPRLCQWDRNLDLRRESEAENPIPDTDSCW
jgi:hypothetical protein